MDERHIYSMLDDLAQQEIPDDMNLWHDLQAKLEPTPQRRLRYLTHLARTAAVLLILAVSAAAYGFYQQWYGGDAGLDAVHNANLIVYFNETKPIESDFNTSVTLEYAYADANRIVVAYTLTGSAPQRLSLRLYPDVNLTDDQGREYPYLPIGGGGGGGGGGNDPEAIITTSQSATIMFDASIVEDAPAELHLTLEIVLAYNTAEMNDPNGMLLAGSTTFDLTLPFNPGLVMDTHQTVSANDVNLTLQKVVVAPSLTRLEMCYNDPAPEGQTWAVWGKVEVNGKQVIPEQQFNVTGPRGEAAGESEPCHLLIIPDALQDYTGAWQLTITALRLPGSEDPAEVVRRMVDDYNIQVIAQPEGGYNFGSDPDSVQYELRIQQLQAVIAELQESIPGPWVFTFTLGK